MFNTNDIKVPIEAFKRKNMADIWMAKLAKEQGVKIVVVEHKIGWLRYLNPQKTIWLSHTKEDDIYQAGVLNSFLK